MFRRMLVCCAAVLAISTVACGDGDKEKTPDGAACTPKTCQSEGKNCGSMPDGCGQVIECGSCTAPEVCGGGGANICGAGTCVPTSCAAEGKNCGTISDNCSDVLSCGTCSAPETCGGGGVANICGASPDGGTSKLDGGSVKSDTVVGPCDPTCMAQPGAVCCTDCGCSGTVKCMPECDSPYQWDCEMRCCYDYTNYKCM